MDEYTFTVKVRVPSDTSEIDARQVLQAVIDNGSLDAAETEEDERSDLENLVVASEIQIT